ncbi:MAG: hypothetical protein HC825_01640 [Oscillatoriales cyanobacterium RM1_1_9]|nr:hypothetical protein [Oscillatoriales cyanobacterium RM1_1_9]
MTLSPRGCYRLRLLQRLRPSPSFTDARYQQFPQSWVTLVASFAYLSDHYYRFIDNSIKRKYRPYPFKFRVNVQAVEFSIMIAEANIMVQALNPLIVSVTDFSYDQLVHPLFIKPLDVTQYPFISQCCLHFSM